MLTTVICGCPMCGATSTVECDADAYFKYVSTSTPIQEIFPNMDLRTRELLISGMCIPCQEKFFTEEDEDDCPFDGDCADCPYEECPC